MYLGKCLKHIAVYEDTIYIRHIHITEATLSKLNNAYHAEPYLSHPIQTYLIVQDNIHTSYQDLSARRKSSQGSARTASPKYTECGGADKPFANISENKLAKNISEAVRILPIIPHHGHIGLNQNVESRTFFLKGKFHYLVEIREC